MPKPKAIVSVINDLVTDRRVHKSCLLLAEEGYEVLLVGRILRHSLLMDERPYQSHRMKLWFEKGVLFYVEFTIRLFFFLQKNKAQLLVANDLDTLWPNYFFSMKRNIPLVYDSHEIFCEVPELQHRPLKKRIWETLERAIVPKLKYCITVNKSIAEYFENKYGVKFHVVRNIPAPLNVSKVKSRTDLKLPLDKKIILLQGAGINIQRGAEEAVEAMQYVEDAILLIIGSGDAIEDLKLKIENLKLQDRVKMLGKMKAEELYHYTANADIGLSLDKDTNLNYRYSLPNKLFDYTYAGIPVLASPLPEIKAFIEKYKVGICVNNHDPKHIADQLNFMLSSNEYADWKNNTKIATAENSWENEQKAWKEIIETISKTTDVTSSGVEM